MEGASTPRKHQARRLPSSGGYAEQLCGDNSGHGIGAKDARHKNASVGIILCQSADKPYVEYAIRDYNKPLGVATYRTADEMPESLKRALPPIDELRKQLEIAGVSDN